MTIEAIKKNEKGIMTLSPQQENVNKPKPKFRFKGLLSSGNPLPVIS